MDVWTRTVQCVSKPAVFTVPLRPTDVQPYIGPLYEDSNCLSIVDIDRIVYEGADALYMFWYVLVRGEMGE